jgi:hypothetical protein
VTAFTLGSTAWFLCLDVNERLLIGLGFTVSDWRAILSAELEENVLEGNGSGLFYDSPEANIAIHYKKAEKGNRMNVLMRKYGKMKPHSNRSVN